MQVKSLKIISLLIAPLLLAACVKQEYPLSVKNDLLSMCMEGIMSGQTPVLDKKHKQENVSKNLELCEFRLANFIKDVDYEDYQRYQLNLYQSFERAFRQKYVLSDVYNNLSDNDQKVFASISKIMLGLGEKDE
ncbi:Uncharacterised protein [Oligella ureolytica]|uniref:Lipoprotein n=1 Tax=Oligella ureolytica TaxID=90244 RepID=A0A378XBT1_9BURK|nr:hypothetical protein [Oligella ureolytica]NLP32879.1 hypothetical protein [Oligella ureolytica]QPT40153.1 hypothetical protein I6G29_00470 [Oligella ureolytica]SUA50283.1 Uncharacterised protein [Oligella ureolytica]